MNIKKWVVVLFVLASAGLLFSGYLSGTKLFSGSCAFGEACPYFLGYPACYYGFAMYLIMFIATGAALLKRLDFGTTVKTVLAVSAVGFIFSGSLTLGEGIWSTCFYGLLFYLALGIVSFGALRRSARPPVTNLPQ